MNILQELKCVETMKESNLYNLLNCTLDELNMGYAFDSCKIQKMLNLIIFDYLQKNGDLTISEINKILTCI